jgi:hypothetical protein
VCKKKKDKCRKYTIIYAFPDFQCLENISVRTTLITTLQGVRLPKSFRQAFLALYKDLTHEQPLPVILDTDEQFAPRASFGAFFRAFIEDCVCMRKESGSILLLLEYMYLSIPSSLRFCRRRTFHSAFS